MSNEPFVDYYELFEASPNANSDTIERLFRYLAKRMHPDVGDGCDVKKFSVLVDAYHTLKDPGTRAAYDAEYERKKQQNRELVSDAACADNDTAERHKLLSLFYAKRRRDQKNPGVAPTSLEQLMGCPPEVLSFHIWYFKEKGWIKREETGTLSITAEGVDRIDDMNLAYATSLLPRLTVESSRLERQPANAC
jgi:curved DNA-binding protein